MCDMVSIHLDNVIGERLAEELRLGHCKFNKNELGEIPSQISLTLLINKVKNFMQSSTQLVEALDRVGFTSL